jgi:hypothetical protein
MKWSETCQNLSFGSNGVHRVRSLRKDPTQLRLANLGVSGASSASFGSNGVDQVRSLRKILTQLCLANLCVNGTSSASFVSTLML